jgi:hypothetical protein
MTSNLYAERFDFLMAEMATIVTPETLLRWDRKRGAMANTLKLNGIEPMILFGEDSLWTAVRELLAHCHGQRNHQRIGSLSLILRVIRDCDSSLAADAQTTTRGTSPENPEWLQMLQIPADSCLAHGSKREEPEPFAQGTAAYASLRSGRTDPGRSFPAPSGAIRRPPALNCRRLPEFPLPIRKTA